MSNQLITYRDRALPMARRGVPTILLRPSTKVAFQDNWPALATLDETEIERRNASNPTANCGCVAQAIPTGVWIFEYDSKNVSERILAETGQRLSTFHVRSRENRGHLYFRQTPKSIEMGNISQAYTRCGDWSARVNNQYCVSPLSLHPQTGQPYIVLKDVDIMPAPDWFCDWCISQKTSDDGKPEIERDAHGLVPHGSIHGYLLHEAGSLRARGLNAEEIEPILLRLTHENCEPPIEDERVIKMAQSICNFPAGKPDIVIVDGHVAGTAPKPNETLDVVALEEERVRLIEQSLDFTPLNRPEFPRWVMEGTSIYRNLAKPASDRSGKEDVLLFMPAFITLMNYAAGKVGILDEEVFLNQHLGLISPAGDYHKSSSCALAFDYVSAAGFLTFSKLNPDGKIVQIQGGSSEGIGNTLYRCGAKHAVVFYDELSKAVSKASILNSTLASDILSWAESRLYENAVKAARDSYSFPQNSYWFSWMWCTTERGFDKQWGALTEKESGLADRVCLILSSEEAKQGPNTKVSFDNAPETFQLMLGATTQGIFPYYDFDAVQAQLGDLNHNKRSEGKAKAFALGFAIDLGRNIIDKDCIARGQALAQYVWDAKEYLKPNEGANAEGRLINEIIREVKRAGGLMKHRELCRSLNANSHGRLWDSAFNWAVGHGEIVDYYKSLGTKGGTQKTRLVGIKRHEAWE